MICRAERLQWHPAAYASIQIELEEEKENLEFENEHQLGTKPMAIDILIVKKLKDKPVRKNIGRIFRKHNVVEYKSPADYLSVDKFYKVYGYTCFYKADTAPADSVKLEDLTITFLTHRYPRDLIRHLRKERGFIIEKVEQGIYYVYGDIFPIQIIVTRYLTKTENLWLHSLTDQLTDQRQAEQLIESYCKHKDNILYEAAMDMIVYANPKQFLKEGKEMCQALRELFADEIRREADIDIKRINELTLKLLELKRMDDIAKAASDTEYQQRLLEEFHL